MSSTTVGKIEKWNDGRGFGFIAPAGGGEDVFVHVSAFDSDSRRPVEGDLVRYVLGRDRRGRAQARNAVFVSGTVSAGPGNRIGTGLGLDLRTAAVAGFFVLLGAVWLAGGVPALIILVYGVMSAVAFGMYALDKKAAREDRWRIAESTLHLVALAGGWPGALLAQKSLRHKTRKRGFQLLFRLCVLINCGVLAWLMASPEADSVLAEIRGFL